MKACTLLYGMSRHMIGKACRPGSRVLQGGLTGRQTGHRLKAMLAMHAFAAGAASLLWHGSGRRALCHMLRCRSLSVAGHML